MSPQIHIKFYGLDAANHVVDMRLLGKSLQGYDRIISDGIILFTQKRLPRRGERAPILIKAEAPKEGSQDIFALLQENASVLPFGWQILTDGTSNFIWHWVSFVLERIGGRKADSERHLEAMLEIIKTHSAERAQTEERRLAHDAAWRDQLFELVNRLIPAAGQAVAPVGTSASHTGFKAGSSPMTMVDQAMADAIRSKGELDISEMQTITLKTEGFRDHDKKLFIVNPEADGFLSAIVNDPLFIEETNPYIEAAARKGEIQVKAKLARRAGQLERIYILDFERHA